MEWLSLVVAPLFALLGVWLGRRLDKQSRFEEREAVKKAELVDQASAVLGRAKMTLDAIHPEAYATYPTALLEAEVGKRRLEADAVRPELSIMAIKWPDAEEPLSEISRFLGSAPVGLERLEFMEGEQRKAAAAELVREKAKAAKSLKEVVKLLHAG